MSGKLIGARTSMSFVNDRAHRKTFDPHTGVHLKLRQVGRDGIHVFGLNADGRDGPWFVAEPVFYKDDNGEETKLNWLVAGPLSIERFNTIGISDIQSLKAIISDALSAFGYRNNKDELSVSVEFRG